MDINRLNEFIVLATHLNYSKAANQLYLTQPALSRHIHDLENTLGAQLFIRDTHNVYLTPIGELFFGEAKDIVSRYQHALDLVKEASQTTTGQLTIGFLGAAVQPFLSHFVTTFTGKHPQIKLTFQCNDIDTLTKNLNEDSIDIAFVTHVDCSFFSGLESETILTDRLMAVVHPNHPLAKKESLSLQDLSGIPIIAFSQQNNPLAHDFHKQLFKKANAHYNIARETPNMETAFFFVSINEGIFIIPSHLKYMAAGLCVLPLEDESCSISLNLVWKKHSPNPSISVFKKDFNTFMQRDEHTQNT